MTWAEALMVRWGAAPVCGDCGHQHTRHWVWVCIGCPCEMRMIVPLEEQMADRTRRTWAWHRKMGPGQDWATFSLSIETLHSGGFTTELKAQPSNGNRAFLAGGTMPSDDAIRTLVSVLWLGGEAL